MSEEEKKAYEKLKKEINKLLEVLEDKCNTFILYNIDNAKIIVNLIEKQQKKIDELKEKEKNLLKQLKDSEKELLEVTQNVISKDKIRAKIKELEGQEDWYIEKKSLDDLYGRIDELKELLEEE